MSDSNAEIRFSFFIANFLSLKHYLNVDTVLKKNTILSILFSKFASV
jgi:hypothetical protein